MLNTGPSSSNGQFVSFTSLQNRTHDSSIRSNDQLFGGNRDRGVANGYSKTFPSCPNKSGPGLWFMLTIMALHAETIEAKYHFIRNLRLLSDLHPCGECREHMKDYIYINPPENYLEFDNGLFDYMVTFHNSVNKRIGKPIMQYEDALYIYTDGLANNICTANCGSLQDDRSSNYRSVTSVSSYNDSYGSYRNVIPVTSLSSDTESNSRLDLNSSPLDQNRVSIQPPIMTRVTTIGHFNG